MMRTPPSAQRTKYWLSWLDSKLKQDNTTEFLVERIQPSWLDSPQKWRYHICVGLASGLLIGAIYGVSTGWTGAGIGGVTYGLILGCTQEVYAVGGLKFSIEHAKDWLLSSVLEGLWWGIVYGLIDALICGLIWGVEGLILGLIESVIWGLIEGIIWGTSVPEFKQMTVSNQGMKESAKSAVTFTLIGGAAWFLLYTLLLKVVNEPLELNSLIVDSIGCGLFFGIYIGGLACLQHFVLRLMLWWRGYIPWNYTEFLDYATSLGFLERGDKSYRFNQEWQHFTQMSLNEDGSLVQVLNEGDLIKT